MTLVEPHSQDARGVSRTGAPVIERAGDGCVECLRCVNLCPTRAITRSDGTLAIDAEKCIACGRCVLECAAGCYRVRDDAGRVRELLRSGRPVVALLATEYVAAMYPRTPESVEHALEALGFATVETTLLGEELVATGYEQAHGNATPGSLPRLRSTCPITVEWVARYYPELTGALVPLVPPYVAQARLVHALYPPEVAIVYISPCWARKLEVAEKYADELDVVIGFDELTALLDAAPAATLPPDRRTGSRPAFSRQLSGTDGFPRRTLEERDLADADIAKIRGLDEVDGVLGAMMRGETDPALVDMLACNGCIDGPCVNPQLSVYAKRTIDSTQRENEPESAVDSRVFLGALPQIEMRRTFAPATVSEPSPLSAPPVDCARADATTPTEFAGSADSVGPANPAASDTPAGQPDASGFAETLAREHARATRYSLPLSLLVLDLTPPHTGSTPADPVPDAMLLAVESLLGDALRTIDVTARTAPAEFSVLLPHTGKTEAWAVAEKLLAQLRTLRLQVGEQSLTPIVSIGIAALAENTASPRSLTDAARVACDRARKRGGDGVDLARS